MAKKISGTSDVGEPVAEEPVVAESAPLEPERAEAVGTVDPGADVASSPEPASPEPSSAEASTPEPSSLEPADDELLPEKDPGRVLGIVSIVASLALGLLGILLGVLAYRSSRDAGFSNTPAMIGMILGVVTTVLLALQLFLIFSNMGIAGACAGLEPGIHTLDNGTTVSCQ